MTNIKNYLKQHIEQLRQIQNLPEYLLIELKGLCFLLEKEQMLLTNKIELAIINKVESIDETKITLDYDIETDKGE